MDFRNRKNGCSKVSFFTDKTIVLTGKWKTLLEMSLSQLELMGAKVTGSVSDTDL